MPDTHGPIQDELKEFMNNLGRGIDNLLNGKECKPKKRKWGFALLIFPFGETPNGRMNYLSNSEREDMLVAMKEFIARNEGRYFGGGGKQ